MPEQTVNEKTLTDKKFQLELFVALSEFAKTL